MGLNNLILEVKIRTGMAKCSDYMVLIQKMADNETSHKEEALLQKHLDLCLNCLDHLNLDVELKKALRHKLQNLPVPEGLADSIRKKISTSV